MKTQFQIRGYIAFSELDDFEQYFHAKNTHTLFSLSKSDTNATV